MSSPRARAARWPRTGQGSTGDDVDQQGLLGGPAVRPAREFRIELRNCPKAPIKAGRARAGPVRTYVRTHVHTCVFTSTCIVIDQDFLKSIAQAHACWTYTSKLY